MTDKTYGEIVWMDGSDEGPSRLYKQPVYAAAAADQSAADILLPVVRVGLQSSVKSN